MKNITKTKLYIAPLILASSLLQFLPTRAMGADGTQVKPSVALVLARGGKKTLESPIRITGRFRAAEFTITRLPIERVVSLQRDTAVRRGDAFKLTLAGTATQVDVVAEDAEISGSGEWGTEKIALGKIVSIQVMNATEPKSATEAQEWDCQLLSGQSLSLTWNSKWSRERSLSGKLVEAVLNLDSEKLSGITRNGNDLTIICGDGFQVEGWEPKQAAISASSPFGSVEVPWSNVRRLSKADSHPTSPAATTTGGDWRVKMKGGHSLPLTDIAAGPRATLNGDLTVESLNWDFIDSATRTQNGLELQLNNGKSWMLEGTLSGKTPCGEMQTPIEALTSLERMREPPKDRIPREYKGTVIASLTTATGNEYPVVDPSLLGGTRAEKDDDQWGHDLFRVKAPPVEFWLTSTELLSGTISFKEGEMFPLDQALAQYAPLSGFTGIEFGNPAGKFSIAIAIASEYTKQATSRSVQRNNNRGTYTLRVSDSEGRTFSAQVTSVQFARRPATGWSGSYTRWQYPLKWHKSHELLFKKQTGDRADIEFKKLAKIEIQGSYRYSRRAKLTSAQGSSIEGTIYPGDSTKSHPGVARWDSSREGLLCRMVDGTYLYIPFAGGTTVEFTHNPPE